MKEKEIPANRAKLNLEEVKLATAKLKEEQHKRELEELERQYMEEGYADEMLEDSIEAARPPHTREYDFLDGLTQSKAMDAMIDKLYAEMPDLQSSCEESQRENIPAIYCNESQSESEDLCNYGISPMISTKSPAI
eukprot:TRINITY_DN12851_c0_g4_i1.p3 TRINITY_DN12851_c0_g4~~TRINITY_DN12851_c0_g4_i1.p3  ORF type:complete len:136 (-),score=38.25 TRINITY_DN12851_c0_g4_i1:93-500(-)